MSHPGDSLEPVAEATVLLLLSLVACGPSGAVPEGTIVRDSAGIRIVESSVDGDVPLIAVSPEPILVLGGSDVPEQQQFVRISEVRLASGGRTVVADWQGRSRVLSVFDGDGNFLHHIGRQGEGPGEFSRIDQVVLTGDSVFVWNMVPHSAQVYRVDGTYRGNVALDRPPPEPGATSSKRLALWHAVEGGRMLSTTGVTEKLDSPHYRMRRAVWLTDSTGVPVPVGEWPVSLEYEHESKDGQMVVFGPVPFGPAGSLAASDSSIWHSNGTDFSLAEYRLDGTPGLMVRVDRPIAKLTPADVERGRSQLLEGEPFLQYRDEVAGVVRIPENRPAYDAVVVDEAGGVWARVFPDTATTADWDIFDVVGVRTGRASLPAGLKLKQIGRDFLLGIDAGEFDEPLVVLYRLERRR